MWLRKRVLLVRQPQRPRQSKQRLQQHPRRLLLQRQWVVLRSVMRELATSLANIAAMPITVCPAWRVTAKQLSAQTMMAGAGNLPELRSASGVDRLALPTVWPCYRAGSVLSGSHRQGTVDADPSLVSYRHVVGYRRSPGNPALHVTHSIGDCRMSLWSTLVVSLRLCGMSGEHPQWWPSGDRRGHRVPA